MWRVLIPGCASLKEKRSVVKSVRERLKNRFNLSVAETGLQDVHARAEVSACVVATDRKRAHTVLESADRLLGEEVRLRVLDCQTTYY